MTTIYTSKKNGKSYTLTNEEIQVGLNGASKLVYTLTNTEDPAEVVTTTESVLKRWYKKSVEVDFTAAKEKPAEKPKASKARKAPAIAHDEVVDLTMAEAQKKFHGFTVDNEAGKVRSGVFHPRKITVREDGVVEFTRRRVLYRVSTKAC